MTNRFIGDAGVCGSHGDCGITVGENGRVEGVFIEGTLMPVDEFLEFAAAVMHKKTMQ